MILADKIIELRKRNGWSQEELAEKLDVSRQAVSKWESAQSVPDMNRILSMSRLFGVSTDYLLKDELETDASLPQAEVSDTEPPLRRVSMAEAQAFLRHREKLSLRIPLGVLLCILSPIAVMLLSVASETGRIPLSEDAAAGAGLLPMFLMIGAAVALFIVSGISSKPYEYLHKEAIETEYGVSGFVREKREATQGAFTAQLVSGIVLCVLCVVPIFAALLLPAADENSEDFRYVAAAAVLLCLVGAGVFLIVRAAIRHGSYDVLLEEGDHSRESKALQERMRGVSAIYWGLVTAGYLAWSFISMRWDRTWIVWPVAAVLYGAVIGVWSTVKKKD